MTKKTATEVTKKWGKNLKNSRPEIEAGIDRVEEAPSIGAVRQQAKMLAKIVESIESGRWAAGLSKVTLEDWKTSMKVKGLGRISAGVDGAETKQIEFYNWLLPRVTAAQNKIKGMPSVTFEDNLARVNAYLREMNREKYKK